MKDRATNSWWLILGSDIRKVQRKMNEFVSIINFEKVCIQPFFFIVFEWKCTLPVYPRWDLFFVLILPFVMLPFAFMPLLLSLRRSVCFPSLLYFFWLWHFNNFSFSSASFSLLLLSLSYRISWMTMVVVQISLALH